ncbi:hypothetical protein EV363DRAFT_1449123 [Boletus edulis]|nr:hypothetical protein EV363DRAFT_1449123 [Boletus edulis]
MASESERESADTRRTQEHSEEENPMAGIGEDSAARWNMGTTDTDVDLRHPSEAELNLPAILVEQSTSRWIVDRHLGAGQLKGDGQTFIARFELDGFSTYRKLNLYYPFSTLQDWQMANFLLTSQLSMRAINDFLSLELIKTLPLSFKSAKELRSCVEMLPSGPPWKFQIIPTTHPTNNPVHLYHHDSLECVEALFNHPLFAREMDLSPYRLFTTAERIVQLYMEWMSGDVAWEMQLQSIKVADNVEEYFAKCEQYRLNGVSHPFFWDWPLSCPSRFLTPECLHYWHRFFWDHDLKWCINALGARELDFRFSVLPPITGICHFGQGVTQLKQIGRRTQRDTQRYIIVVLFGFPDADVLTAIRVLMDFCYLVQAPVISSITCDKIATALTDFHQHKHAILKRGLRRGPTTDAPLDHFNIPKIEFMHHVVPSINNTGNIIQWSADTTEHAHIKVIKDPAAMMNNTNYDSQICRTLDEKCRLFNTAITLSKQSIHMEEDNGSGLEPERDDEVNGNEDLALAEELWSPQCNATDLFARAEQLLVAPPTFHLTRDPLIRHISIDDAATQFNLPDLRGALGDYLNREGTFTQNFHTFSGARRSPANIPLPFNKLQIWYKAHLQQKSYYDPSILGSAFTVHAHPPDRTWKYGNYSAAVLNVDEAHAWPSSGLLGHAIVLVRMIMCPAPPRKQRSPWANRFLIYTEHLDIVTQANGSAVEPSLGLHILKRATCALHPSGSRIPLGEIFPLDQLRSYCHVTPRFGPADTRLSRYNSIHASSTMLLNKYYDKDFYYAITGS